MENKGAFYLKVFTWVLLLLVALILEKSLTTILHNTFNLGLFDAEVYTSYSQERILENCNWAKLLLGIGTSISLTLFVLRYLLFSPYRIYGVVFNKLGLAANRNLPYARIIRRLYNTTTYDVYVSFALLILEFLLVYFLVLSIGIHAISLTLLCLLPALDYISDIITKLKHKNNYLINNYSWPNWIDFWPVASVGVVHLVYNFCLDDNNKLDLSSSTESMLILAAIFGTTLGSNLWNYKYYIKKKSYDAFRILTAANNYKSVGVSESSSNTTSNCYTYWNEEHVETLKKLNYPEAYINNSVLFRGLNFYIDPRAYIPNPETEFLVETVVEYINEVEDLNKVRIYDVGTGIGNIIISIIAAFNGKHWYEFYSKAIDFNPNTLAVARHNVNKFCLEQKLDLILDDYVSSLKLQPDIIVADLPYGYEDTLLPSLSSEQLKFYPAGSIHPQTEEKLDKGNYFSSYKELLQLVKDKKWRTKIFVEIGIADFNQFEEMVYKISNDWKVCSKEKRLRNEEGNFLFDERDNFVYYRVAIIDTH